MTDKDDKVDDRVDGMADDSPDTEPVYYYSRERRLKRASKTVREFNDSSGARPGVIRSIAGNKGNIFLLVSILIVCVMLVLTARSREPDGFAFAGNNIELSILNNGDGGFSLAVQKTIPEEGAAYAGAVDLVISPTQDKPLPGTENPPPQIVTHRFFFSLLPEEVEIVPLPFESDEFIVMLQAEEERVVRRIRPRKE